MARATELEPLLRAQAVTTVLIVGLATDYCVYQTALDAQRRGFRTIVLADATRAVERAPGDGTRALERLRASGVEVR
jgi:nicotinamidase/pyrazinamidase